MRRRFAIPLLISALALVAGAALAMTPTQDVCHTSLASRLLAGPIVEVPAAKPKGEAFVVLYSGDGGWAEADCAFSHGLAARGLSVVGVNSVRYFAEPKTPEAAAADLQGLIDTYAKRWSQQKVILMGYSFGASALPIVAQHLPAQTRARVEGLALAGPGERAELVLRPRTWFGEVSNDAIPVEPAIQRLAGLKIVCVYAREDHETVCPHFKPGEVQLAPVPGTHRFDTAYAAVVDAVAKAFALPS